MKFTSKKRCTWFDNSSYIHVADLIAYSQMAHATIEMPAPLVETLTGLRRQSFSDNGHRAYDKVSGMVNLNDIRTLIIKQLGKDFSHKPIPVKLRAAQTLAHQSLRNHKIPNVLRMGFRVAVMEFLEKLQDNYPFEYARPEGLDITKAERIKAHIDANRQTLKPYLSGGAQYLPIMPVPVQYSQTPHKRLYYPKLGVISHDKTA